MKSLQRVTGFIGLLLMAAFLLPYIFKLATIGHYSDFDGWPEPGYF